MLKWPSPLFMTALLSLTFWVPAPLRAGLKESWSYYENRVAQGTSAEQREQILNQILSNPRYADKDLSFVRQELNHVRTKVSFEESLEYYDQRVQAGVPRADQMVLLEKIIAKYGARGMDMTELKNQLVSIQPAPEPSNWEEPVVLVPPLGGVPEKPEPSSWSIELMGGFHSYPNTTFFQSNSGLFDVNELDGSVGNLGVRRRFERFSWGLETGGYGGTAHFHQLNGAAALIGQTRIETIFVRVSPYYHFTDGMRLFDFAVGGGSGAYFWKKSTDIVINTIPSTSLQEVSNGTAWGFHIASRLTCRLGAHHGIFIDYSYAVATENDTEKINARGDTINFGGQAGTLGVSLAW